jgi:L-ascorbate metabolism protein UlaG (beta-lactamase superfamily)
LRGLAGTGAVVYAPVPVVEMAAADGLDCTGWRGVAAGEQFSVGDLRITVYPSRDSEKTSPVNRVGFCITDGIGSIFHQGDSHGCSPSWQPMAGKLDLLIMWPKQVLDVVAVIHPKTILFHPELRS